MQVGAENGSRLSFGRSYDCAQFRAWNLVLKSYDEAEVTDDLDHWTKEFLICMRCEPSFRIQVD